jgi:hypothetical protein
MVLRTELTAKKFPEEIAWVLPFPSLPSKYEEVDGPLFQELARMISDPAEDGATFGSKGMPSLGGRGASDGIKVHDQVQAGQYLIQPIEIINENSGKELNAWLKKNKFNSMPEAKQKRYLKKGAAFLAIRMKMNQPGEATLVSRPLHVTYASDSLSVPMLFTHDERVFDLDIYVFSQKEMKHDLSKLHFSQLPPVAYKREHVRPMVESLLGERSGWITRYRAKELNSKDKKLSLLKEDPTFTAQIL